MKTGRWMWVALALVVLVLPRTAFAQFDVTAIDPSTIGVNSTPTVQFVGAVPSATTQVAFAQSGRCNVSRFSTTPLPSSDTAVLATGVPVAGSYVVCYSVDGGALWTQQAVPTLTVVDATPSSISSVTPSTIGAGSTPTMTFTGAVPTPTSYVAFAPAGQCSSGRVGTTALPSSDTAPLGVPIPTAGTFVVCYSVDNGVTWPEQTGLVLTVVEATPVSISAISPSAIGAGTHPTMTLTGAVATPTTRFAFAISGSCATSRFSETALPDDDTEPLASTIPAGTYKLCYSVDDGGSWIQQTAPVLSVVQATAISISSISPDTIGAGTQPTMTFTGAAPTPTTKIAFALSGSCATSRFAETALPDDDTEPLASTIPAGTYKLCYTVDDGGSWIQQSAPSLSVVQATATSITTITPSVMVVHTQPTVTFTGARATPTSQVAFALPGSCSTARVGTTALPTDDTEPLGSAISSLGEFKVCYTVDGISWVEQTAPAMLVDHAACTAGEFDSGPSCQACGNGGAAYDCGSSSYRTGASCDGSGTTDTQTCSACTICGAGEYESSPCLGASDRTCGACDSSCSTCAGPGAGECESCPSGAVHPTGYCLADGECAPVPSVCQEAAQGSLAWKHDDDPSRRTIQWKWKDGTSELSQADFGDPESGADGFQLCVYGDTGGAPVIASATIAPGGTCDTKPCWKAVSTKGWSYGSKSGAADGVTKVKLIGGDAGKPDIQVKGKGTGLVMLPPLGETESVGTGTPVVVQLERSDLSACWSSRFLAGDFTKNDGTKFQAKFP